MLDVDDYYTPARVRSLLEHWEALEGWTQGMSVAAFGSGRGNGSSSTCSEIRADLERAWARLPPYSLGWRAVEVLMQGKTLVELAGALHLPFKAVYVAYLRATQQMARELGWRPNSETRSEG